MSDGEGRKVCMSLFRLVAHKGPTIIDFKGFCCPKYSVCLLSSNKERRTAAGKGKKRSMPPKGKPEANQPTLHKFFSTAKPQVVPTAVPQLQAMTASTSTDAIVSDASTRAGGKRSRSPSLCDAVKDATSPVKPVCPSPSEPSRTTAPQYRSSYSISEFETRLKGTCRFFGSSTGCRDGSKCPLMHTTSCWPKRGGLLMPHSVRNTFRVTGGEGTASATRNAWVRIHHVVSNARGARFSSPDDALQVMLSLLPPPVAKSLDITMLGLTLTTRCTESERRHFLNNVFPWMLERILDLPVFFPDGVPLLVAESDIDVLRFTEEECLLLVNAAFFSLYPYRYRASRGEKRQTTAYSVAVPDMNFNSLFSQPGAVIVEKIAALLQYFVESHKQQSRWTRLNAGKHSSEGSSKSKGNTDSCMRVVEFIRVSIDACKPALRNSRTSVASCKLDVVVSGNIEDDHGALQWDFANRFLGGGVLGRGCVQEEIRILVCPELLVARLVCEAIQIDEVVVMNGARQFCSYVGYASTFKASKPCAFGNDSITMVGNAAQLHSRRRSGPSARVMDSVRSHPPLELLELPQATSNTPSSFLSCGTRPMPLAMLNVSVVAVDAVNFSAFGMKPSYQYAESWTLREAVKAFAGFVGTPHSTLPAAQPRSGIPSAAGNWGCGAFSGDVEYKAIVQLCAAAEAGRPVTYYSFGSGDFSNKLAAVWNTLCQQRVSVGEVVNVLLAYDEYRRALCSQVAGSAAPSLVAEPSLAFDPETGLGDEEQDMLEGPTSDEPSVLNFIRSQFQ